MMATAGASCFDLRENRRSSGMSSPIVMATRGPIQVMALIEDTRPRQISGADDAAADARRTYACRR